jgi:hypothetical protein
MFYSGTTRAPRDPTNSRLQNGKREAIAANTAIVIIESDSAILLKLPLGSFVVERTTVYVRSK